MTNRQIKKNNPGTNTALGNWIGILGGGISIIGAIAWMGWYASKVDSRIEHVEERITGNGGLRDQLRAVDNALNEKDGLRDQIRVLTTKVDMIDKQFLKEQQARGAKLLKTSDVNIVRAGLLQNEKFSVPYKNKATAATKQKFLLTYVVESITDDAGIILRVALHQLDPSGQLGQSLYDRRVVIDTKLSPVGIPQDYEFKLFTDKFETPSFHFKFVVLERFGRDNLILATALLPEEPTS